MKCAEIVKDLLVDITSKIKPLILVLNLYLMIELQVPMFQLSLETFYLDLK